MEATPSRIITIYRYPAEWREISDHRFTSEYPPISDHTVKVIGRDFKWLLETDRLSEMRFRDLQQNRGLLLIMNMDLHLANVGGRCGVDEPLPSANYWQAVFWYVINIFRHASQSPLMIN